jgi:RNA polymerase sigma-70 factor, ECF subfamily
MQQIPPEVFERERSRLTALAYGILGSVMEAEDAVQEAYLRPQPADGPIQNVPGWLTTVVSRISIDRLRSAQKRREHYVGEWLPEPVLRPRQEQDAITRSRLSIAFLQLMERLEPEQRAVFVLREVFDHSYREIAELLDRSEAACRQIVTRARAVFADLNEQPDMQSAQSQTVDRFMEALVNGDEQGLLELLANDAVLIADGGGKVQSVLNPIYGADRVIRFFFGVAKKRKEKWTLVPEVVNSEPGLGVYLSNQFAGILAFSIREGKIVKIYSIANPEKLNDKTK